LKAREWVPVLMRTARYWRAPQIGWTLRMLVALHQTNLDEAVEDKQRAYFQSTPLCGAGGGCARQWSVGGKSRHGVVPADGRLVAMYAHPEFACAIVNLMCVRAPVAKNQAAP
jgi:hypothetical protein